MNDKISIVTVCYNSVGTLQKTIESVINQTYQNIEYIIVDGGSTDGTLDIIRDYKDSLACWVSEPDDGLYYAMNKGIGLATGDVIAFMNSDDWYANNDVIEKVMHHFHKYHSDVIYGDFSFVNNEGDLTSAEYVSKADICQDDLFYCILYCHQALFVRTELQRKILFDETYHITADYKSQLQLYVQGYKFAYLGPGNLVYFRRGGVNECCPRMSLFESYKAAREVVSAHKKLKAQYLKKIRMHYKVAVQPFLEEYLFKRHIKYHQAAVSAYLRDLLGLKKAYVIFGTGMIGKKCRFVLQTVGVDIQCFIDNNIMDQKGNIDGVPVQEVEKFLCQPFKGMIIIASIKYPEEMCKQLRQFGLVENKDFLIYTKIIENYKQQYFFRGPIERRLRVL